jgi:hypothetical protein
MAGNTPLGHVADVAEMAQNTDGVLCRVVDRRDCGVAAGDQHALYGKLVGQESSSDTPLPFGGVEVCLSCFLKIK